MAHEVNKAEVDYILGKCDRSDFLGCIQTIILADSDLRPYAGAIFQRATQIKSFDLVRYESMAHQAEEFCQFVRGTRGKPTWL